MMALARNPEGYLTNWQDWNETIALQLAAEEQIALTPAHWQVIHYLRLFYENYEHTPVMRILVKQLQLHYPEQSIDSPYLYTLFPKGPIKQGCKIAGLPKPPHCI
jgi:tRNA 2-thiouridine synthesizing protein E